MNELLRVFFAYFRSRLRLIAGLLLFCLIFAAVFALYGLPAAAVGYGLLLCGFFGLLFSAIDFYHFYSKHKSLWALKEVICLEPDHLPLPDGLIEGDYQELVQALQQENRRVRWAERQRFAELGDYCTLWAHQIKTPIAALDLLLQNQETAACNRELREELRRVEHYVEMVLCYLRLDSDSTDYVLREYELDGIIAQALRKYASQFIRRRLRLDYQPLCCRVLSDEKWLLFVIEQILSNALKYTHSGGVSIKLEPPRTLVIADTGIGIAQEDLPRVFDKSFTGYNGREDKRASGIGLYLCRRVTDKLGHGLSITSEAGRGTTVRLDLEQRRLETE